MLRLTTTHDRSVRVSVHARPRASRSEIAGVREGALVVRLAAPPVDGAANAELLVTLADALCIPRHQVSLVSGSTHRAKVVEIRGLEEADVRARLEKATG